ncbi:MAG TPA: response regulator [Phenylobacterium sp.]|uniref:sensor histidine kinase n=1 Tax=Phenylobacterium sp. TaxID=1871053 RepID=UPI002B47C8DD|nr:response regulator [Phenylobacterium sp.]HKR88529.1 response regulator [Phenylobacterium sp.]
MNAEVRRVLFIDDDEGLRRLVARALSRRGYEVTLAACGEEGLRLAREQAFDVIALDHYMPGLGGFETLRGLLAELRDTPIVYVTGSDETRVAVTALKAGAADYVVKVVGDEFFELLDSAFTQALKQVRLRRQAAAAEEALRAGNQRLQALLREVNHRVANSLQLVSAFVQLQAAALDDEAARAALGDTQRRIEAVGQVHRRLYTSDDVESVDMAAYLDALVGEMQESWAGAIGARLTLSAEPIRLGADRAVSLGVIVNELITNACKYAYAPGEDGEVRISLRKDGHDALRLVVEDDGRGLEPGSSAQGTGLGARVIRAMAESLGAQIAYDPGHHGVRAILTAPL